MLNLEGIADATFNSFPLPKGIIHKAYFILDVLQVQYAKFVHGCFVMDVYGVCSTNLRILTTPFKVRNEIYSCMPAVHEFSVV